MLINNTELNFDIEDYEEMKKFEEAFEKCKKTLEEVKQEEINSTSEKILAECKIIFAFFDDIFGEGKHKEIFKGKINSRICNNALFDFADEIMHQKEMNLKETEERANKYSYNRAARRSKK